MDCHRAGNHDTVGSIPFTNVDLSLSMYTVDRIKNELKPAASFTHSGTQTNLDGTPAGDIELDQKITALRQFLDSTLPGCP